MTYETLLAEADSNGIYVIENADFESNSDGLINNNVIGLNKNVKVIRQRACILAEELGHYYTTTGDILNQRDAWNRKQEYRARLWAYNKQIGLRGIVDAFKANCMCVTDMAEHLNVTEEFLKETLEAYKRKYGMGVKIDNYIIGFEPNLYVVEMFK